MSGRPLPRLLRLLVAAALLAAQQAALSHQIWHLGRDAAVGAQSSITLPGGKQPEKSTLCEFHAALGAVLGALNGAVAALAPAVVIEVAFLPAAVPAAGRHAPAPSSRDPPLVA